MGSWNETCMLSHPPILFGDNIKVIILIKKHNTPCAENVYFNDGYTPLTFPFDATYDDYGGIANVNLPDYALKQLQSANLFVSKQDAYKFTTVAQLIDDINEDCIYLKLDNEFLKLECVYIHKELYDTLINRMAIRKPYHTNKTLYELYKEQYNAVKDKWLTLMNDKKASTFEKVTTQFTIEFTFENQYYGDYGFLKPIIRNGFIKPDTIDDFIDAVCKYRLFTNALSEGRIGFITRCGTGSQSCSIFTQKIIAEFILKESQRTTEDGDPIYDAEETLLWYRQPKQP